MDINSVKVVYSAQAKRLYAHSYLIPNTGLCRGPGWSPPSQQPKRYTQSRCCPVVVILVVVALNCDPGTMHVLYSSSYLWRY